MGTTPKILRNAGSTTVLRNAAGDKIVRNLDGAACPDPCDYCGECVAIPFGQSIFPDCIRVRFSGITVPRVCIYGCYIDGNIDFLCTRVLYESSLSGINTTFVLSHQGGGVYTIDDPRGSYMVSLSWEAGPSCPGATVDDLCVSWDEDCTAFNTTGVSLSVELACGPEQCITEAVVNFDFSSQVGSSNGCLLGQGTCGGPNYPTSKPIFTGSVSTTVPGDSVIGTSIVNQRVATCGLPGGCSFLPLGPDIGGGQCTIEIPANCDNLSDGMQETLEFAQHCDGTLPDITVNAATASSPVVLFGGEKYELTGQISTDPSVLSTPSDLCDSPPDPVLWPTASRCDGTAGQITFDPATRGVDDLICSYAGNDYYPDNGEVVAAPVTVVWSQIPCSDFDQAVRCLTANITGLPLVAQNEIPATISYDPALLGGNPAANYTIVMRYIIVVDTGGPVTEYCVLVPYQCTTADGDADDPIAISVQNYDCNSLPFGQVRQGWLCPGGDPAYGCNDCCGTADYPVCCALPQYRLCTCCLNAPA